MLDRTAERFGFKPKRLIADCAYGSAPNLARLVQAAAFAVIPLCTFSSIKRK
jgi:hypothetical protein